MGSSNGRRYPSPRRSGCSRDPSWGVQTQLYGASVTAGTTSRSLMGRVQTRAALRRGSMPGLPRDPSWGVQTEEWRINRLALIGSRSLMGSSNSNGSRPGSIRSIRSRSLMGSSNHGITRIGRVREGLAIPHGEFKLAVNSAPLPGTGGLAIPHGEFKPGARSSFIRSGGARDPSWGVQTCCAAEPIRQPDHLAIPHGEFKPTMMMALGQARRTSRSLMGSSNGAMLTRHDVSLTSRSLMGSSNPSKRPTYEPSKLAIPHGEFKRDRYPSPSRAEDLAIPHGEFKPRRERRRRLIPGLAIPHGEFKRDRYPSPSRAEDLRDPSWGVQTLMFLLEHI